MSVKAAAIVSVKVLAIFTFLKFITFLQAVSSIIDMVSNSPSSMSAPTQIVLTVSPIFLLLIVSICLWLYADEISNRIVGNLKVSEKVNLSYDDLQSIAFSVVGLLITTDTLPYLLSAVAQLKSGDSYQARELISIGSQSLKLLIGIWLLFGSRGIVGLIRSLRTAGLKKNN